MSIVHSRRMVRMVLDLESPLGALCDSDDSSGSLFFSFSLCRESILTNIS